MSRCATEKPPVMALPVAGQGMLFPPPRICSIGRNDAAEVIDMENDPDREDPFFFPRNPDKLDIFRTFPYPATHRSDVHHEAEMIVVLKTGGTTIQVEKALEHVFQLRSRA